MNKKIAESAGFGLVGHSRKQLPKYWIVVGIVTAAMALYLFLKD
jgi:hypothetical protein